MRLQQYLTEKTYNIGADVDLVYNKIVKPSLSLYHKGKYKEFSKKYAEGVVGYMTSGDLKSKQAKQAHKMNPMNIYFARNNKGNYYDPPNRTIHFSLNIDVINILDDGDFEEDRVKLMVGDAYDRFMNELSEGAIKGTIYHELSHWLNDTLHNRNITKVLRQVSDTGKRELMKRGHSSVDQTFMEIDAQVHALKQLKRTYSKIWDTLTWEDILKYKPSFTAVFGDIQFDKKEYEQYRRNILKRMNREKLLTKNLREFPLFKDMFSLLRKL